MTNNAGTPMVEAAVTIPVVQEELRVDTRTIDTGRGVRVSKSVTERPVQVDEILQHDDVDITRVPVDRMVASGEAPESRYEGDTLIVPILEEVLVVERRMRIKEELHITRVRREHRHVETVILQSEEVTVERFDEASDS